MTDKTHKDHVREIGQWVRGRWPGSESHPEELLVEIETNESNNGPRLVYADWLIEHGDPRGEMIALQLTPDDKRDKHWVKQVLRLTKEVPTSPDGFDVRCHMDNHTHSVAFTISRHRRAQWAFCPPSAGQTRRLARRMYSAMIRHLKASGGIRGASDRLHGLFRIIALGGEHDIEGGLVVTIAY